MPTLTRRSLAPLLLPLCWPGPAAAEPPLTLPGLMARLAAIPARRAPFIEHRRLAALTEPLESRGHLLYRRPSYLEKVTDWPEPESLVVDGDRLILTEATGAPHVVPLSAQPGLRTLVDAIRAPLSGDLDALRRAFTVTLDGTPDRWHLTLIPLDPSAARFLRTVRITGAGDAIQNVLTTQANGDEQSMQIGPPT